MASIFGLGLGGRSGSLFGKLSKDEINDVVNTVIGEAGGEGAKGMAAVAAVIKNRSEMRGKSPAEIVAEPNQFAAFSNPGSQIKKEMQDPALRAEAMTIVQSVFDGKVPDPTDGADHYHADGVTPDWAKSMPETKKIGNHVFYRSSPTKKASSGVDAPGLASNIPVPSPRPVNEQQASDVPSYDSLMSSFNPDDAEKARSQTGGAADETSRDEPTTPFDAILTQDRKAKGLAGIVENPERGMWAPVGNFVARGADKVDPRLVDVLQTTAEQFPGYRVEAFSGYRPGDKRFHGKGEATDIRLIDEKTGKEVPNYQDAGGFRVYEQFAQKARQVQMEKYPDLADSFRWGGYFSGQKGKYGAVDLMHFDLGGSPSLGMAGGTWDDGLTAQQRAYFPGVVSVGMRGQKIDAKTSPQKSNAIVLDDTFKPANGLGIFGDGANSLVDMQKANKATADATQAAASDQAEANRMAGFTDMHNREAAATADQLNQQQPGRYEVMDPAQADKFQQDWQTKNQSSGIAGDTVRNWTIGAASGAQQLGNVNRLIISKLPYGDKINATLDSIDRWFTGGMTSDELNKAVIEKQQAELSPGGKAAAEKKWWDGEKRWFGPAWSDPQSYIAMSAQSAPSTIATMLPSGMMARGAYLAKLAAGATPKVAAAVAAKTAAIAGGLGEGFLGGAQSAQTIKDEIAAMPRDQLAQSDAVKSLVSQGMTEDQAIASISSDAQTQAFIVTGVTTGIFGGMGDRTLAKILAEGVGGGVVKRTIRGMVRGAVSEGVLEELPQNVTQQMSENAAMQKVDPNRSIMQDVPEAAASGLAGGVAMGGVMGGAAGAGSPAESHVASAPEDAAPVSDGYIRVAPEDQQAAQPSAPVQATPAPVTSEAGPIGRSVGHAERSIAQRAQAVQTGAPVPTFEKGATVRVDEPGIEPFMGTVDSIDGNDAIIMDSSTGELLQVPARSLTQIASSPSDIAAGKDDTSLLRPKDTIPEQSTDPALEPAAPKAADVTTEPLPPPTQQKPATERFPSAPNPGERVIVDDKAGQRFAGTVRSYELGGKEAVVETDDGKSLQVKTDQLFVSNQTKEQIAAEDAKRNPPVARDISNAGPDARNVNGKTVVMPDDLHARLYDLGHERLISKKTMGASQLDLGAVGRDSAAQIAKDFGISPDAVGSLADDYRFRVERSAKNAQYSGAIKMPAVDPRRLRQWQREQEKATGAPPATSNPDADWWDGQLTAQERRKVLDAAGVKRSERMQWAGFTPAIREKLLAKRAPEEQPAPKLDTAAHEAATSPQNELPEPSQAQKDAGNYKLGHVKLGDLDISVENPAGSTRSGVDGDGKPWSVEMKSHYGYIKGTVGRDKDHVDIFVKPGTQSLDDAAPVYVVDQVSPNGRFDEHKVMAGFENANAARQAYLENYTKGWKGLGKLTETTLGEFKNWLANGDTTKAFGRESVTAAPPAAPASKPKKTRPAPYLDRYENYFKPGREVPSYFGTDRVESFNRGENGNWNVNVRAINKDGTLGELRSHSTAPNERELAKWERDNPVAPKPRAEKKKLEVSENTVFTEDAAQKARELLRRKLGTQLNSGIDPEIMQAGITLAGYHIERGARTFAAFAKAMLADLGEDVRPYLKSWYMGVKYDPRAVGFDGMSTGGEVETANVDTIGSEGDEPQQLEGNGAPALERVPAGSLPATEGRGYTGNGAEPRSGTDVSRSEPVGKRRVSAGRSVSDGQGELLAPAGTTEATEEQRSASAASGGNEREEGRRRINPSEGIESAATPAQNRAVDYSAPVATNFEERGQKAKFRANVAAIETLRDIQAENRAATRDEQDTLAKWAGWGGLRQAFPREDGSVAKGWEKEAKQLKELLTPEEFRAAESSTRNAHYTSTEVVNAIWDIAKRLGFKGGNVLEPSVGAGNFIALMPADARAASKITGVELDSITGGIAKALYPSANIQAPMGFEKLTIPDGYFDLAVGNPPFGSEKVYDKNRPEISKFSIHNFFFAKSVDALRPGGLLTMVVTNRFLDGPQAPRAYLAKRAALVGAIRLPNTAFQNAGTEVTTDIVVLHKLADGEKADTSWIETRQYAGKDGKKVPLNRYFIEHSEMMLGDFGAYGTMYGPDEPALIARPGQDIASDLQKAISKLPEGLAAPRVTAIEAAPEQVADGVNEAQIGSLFVSEDGSIHQRIQDHIGEARSTPVDFPSETAKERVTGMVRIRDAFARLRRAQVSQTATNAQVEALRDRLNKIYDAFVKKHGPINADANKRLFRDDPTWPQISALEKNFDKGVTAAMAQKTGEKARAPSAEKEAIFSRRTQTPYAKPETAASAKDALATVLNERGRVDLDAISELYGEPKDKVVAELGGLIFKTPAGDYQTADEYLSGNVKKKLAEAERALEADPALARNVAALRDVQPSDIEPVDIDVKPGSPWIPPQHIADFLHHISESTAQPSAYYSAANAKWDINVPSASAAATTMWGTDRASVSNVLNAALNGQSITIYDRFSDGTTKVNQADTDAANEKVERVKQEWNRWIWKDDARRDELARLYNDTFNTDVLRVFDGSHLTLPGKVSDEIITLRPHQKNFVWRALQSSTALADHVVGAGKTFSAITAAMEMRRIGVANKPLFVVPNHLVGQWASDFVKLYPGAKVLAATKKDFDKENRKRLMARIATGDWDAVIIAHSSFERIGVDPEFESRFIAQQMEDLETSISDLRSATGQKSRNVAQLTKWRDNLKAKLERLLDAGRKDDGLYFDETGVDALFVDEEHEFKNLAYATSMNRVAGLGNPSGSMKASDLYMKSRYVLERGGRFVSLTGTPLSNTMAEMYTQMRYHDEKSLRDMGISHFDAWARVFGEVVTDWELSPSGQYKLNSRFAKFVNVPELMQRYLSFADVISNDDIKAQLAAIGKKLPLPKVKGGKPTNIVVERSPDQAAFIGVGRPDTNGNMEFPQGSLVYRAENLPKKAEKGGDNMLKVMSDARKAALDMRLIDQSYGDYALSKVNRAADELTRIYHQWDKQRGTQLVFIDLSTPKKARAKEEAALRALIKRADEGDETAQEQLDKMSPDEFMALQTSFSVYDDLKEKLLARGIPDSEIAFIHDANTEAQKEELFGKVRSGRVRFLFGSTAKMGAGTNVQNRLVALHHLDAPWRPSDLEQRDGRGIRQGNELYNENPDGFEIEILRYATENTLDARQWQTIEAKARFIQQVRKGNSKERQIEDIGGEAANAAEMKAAASGNPLILEEMDTRKKLRTLEGQAAEHEREQHRIKAKVRNLNAEAEGLRARADDVKADAARVAGKTDLASFGATIDGQTFEKPKEYGAAIISAIREAERSGKPEGVLGQIGGFDVSFSKGWDGGYVIDLDGARNYQVDLGRLEDENPTGTAMRVVNTLRRLADGPAVDEARIEDIQKQIPGLEKQIGAWPNAKELSDTAARHRQLIDALKPKPKGDGANNIAIEQQAPETLTPNENKRPDPVIRNVEPGFTSKKPPARPVDHALSTWAKNSVLNDGRRTGHEYIVAIDDDGSIVEYGTAGRENNTGMSARLAGAIANEDRRLGLYHNHPNNSPISAPDIAMLAWPGIYFIAANGHEGRDTRAALTDAAAKGATKLNYISFLKMLESARSRAMAKANLTEAQNNELWEALPAEIAARANIIDFETNMPYDFKASQVIDDAVDSAALQLAREFYGTEAKTSSGIRGPSRAIRHIGGMAVVDAGRNQASAQRSGPSGLAEGSARYDRQKVSARENRVTNNRIIEELNGKLVDIQPALLKTIPLNYFTDLARPNMTAVGDYMRMKRAMDTYRGNKHAEADAIAQEWLKYARLGFAGKDKARAQELSELMHDSTIAGVDPSVDRSKLPDVLRAEFPVDDPTYQILRKRFLRMPAKGQQLFEKVRDTYQNQAEELDQILLDNVRKAQEIAREQAEKQYRKKLEEIEKSDLDPIHKRQAVEDAQSAYRSATTKSGWAAKARLTKLRKAFEASRVKAPYFPLGRFGRYFVSVRDNDGNILSFSKYERAAERDRAAKDLAREYRNASIETGVMEDGGSLRNAMDPRIVADIEDILGDADVSPEIMDQIWQRYLESMPDLSARKRFIHRKGTAGYAADALRTFSSHMFHAAHQMARTKFGLEMQELVDQTMDQAKTSDDQTRGVTLANELVKRHQWVMNPTGSKVAQTMTSAAFVWFLAASPASAIVNMAQTPMMGVPILGARFGGVTKSATALAKAAYDSMAGRGSVANSYGLSADEKQAVDAFYQSGLIDRTQSHDLAGVGETGVEYSPLRAKIMGTISWAFHRAEVWNREVTALAAYRLARDSGQPMATAIDTAHDLTWKTHFDYSNSSRPSIMQNDFAKVALVFRNYNINMLYRVFRDIHQSVAGESAQAKREARYQLAGVIGMMTLMGGLTGTFGYSLAMSLAGALFGDDDDPMDFEQTFKKDVLDILGPQLGGVVLNGVPGHYLGIDLSSRIGMPDLWFRSPARDLQGKEEYQYWLSQTLGATVGLGEQVWNGASLMMDGDIARGVEMLAPKSIRDIMKSYRYMNHGLTTVSGNELMPASAIGFEGAVLQALGFTPASVSEQWDRSTALKNAQSRVMKQRQKLINKWAMAAGMGDKQAASEALANIKHFNASPINRQVAITQETLQRSMKQRARNEAKREDGAVISDPGLGKMLREKLPARVY